MDIPVLQAIILDLDGVIVDSEPLYRRVEEEQFARYGIWFTDAEWASFKGIGEKKLYDYSVREHGFKEDFQEYLTQKKQRLIDSFARELRLFPDALDFIGRFQGRYRLALTSSSEREVVDFILKKFYLLDVFRIIVTGSDITHSKPHPEPYLKTVKGLGLKPEECIAVEDSVNGIRSVRAAGIKCIAITTSFGRDALQEANEVVDNMGGITEILLHSLWDGGGEEAELRANAKFTP
ncbi:HAD family phosphatase [candidate division KSB1 bacterium]|nr:HAD family phosphatase [candidate division KSB1 bacterium]